MKERSIFWDNYKGILIFLVVFGHFIYSYANNLPDSFVHDVYMFVYTFHMPAFIFCSGYFSKSERSRSKEALVKLLVYYVVFNTLMMLFDYFYLGKSIKLLTPYYSYWYILSLIVWRAVIGEIARVKGLLVISILMTLAVGYCSEFSNVLSLRRAVAFFVFFAAGYLIDKEKIERFIRKRKAVCMWLFIIPVALMAIAAFWAVDRSGMTGSMTMMGVYTKNTDILRRILLIIVSVTAIFSMMMVVPGRKVPLLSKVGKNSLLIYLVHRFITIIFYKEWFTYETYSHSYLIYAFVAAVLTCIVFGSEKLNSIVAGAFDRISMVLVDKESRAANVLKTIMLIIFIVLLYAKKEF